MLLWQKPVALFYCILLGVCPALLSYCCLVSTPFSLFLLYLVLTRSSLTVSIRLVLLWVRPSHCLVWQIRSRSEEELSGCLAEPSDSVYCPNQPNQVGRHLNVFPFPPPSLSSCPVLFLFSRLVKNLISFIWCTITHRRLTTTSQWPPLTINKRILFPGSWSCYSNTHMHTSFLPPPPKKGFWFALWTNPCFMTVCLS